MAAATAPRSACLVKPRTVAWTGGVVAVLLGVSPLVRCAPRAASLVASPTPNRTERTLAQTVIGTARRRSYNTLRAELWHFPAARFYYRRVFSALAVPGIQTRVVDKRKIADFLSKPVSGMPYVLFVIDDAYQSSDASTYNWPMKKLGPNGRPIQILDDPDLVQLFAEDWVDPIANHPKLTVLPIGLESRAVHWKQSKDFAEMAQAALSLPPTAKRSPRVLSTSHHSAQAKGRKPVVSKSALGLFPRRDMVLALQNRSYIDFLPRLSRPDTYAAHAKYAFELCPEGNGLDTHRFYESIILGTIPVVKRSHLSKALYWRFPHVVVDEWEDLRPDHLATSHELLAPIMQAAKSRVTMGYWMRVVESALESQGYDPSTYVTKEGMRTKSARTWWLVKGGSLRESVGWDPAPGSAELHTTTA